MRGFRGLAAIGVWTLSTLSACGGQSAPPAASSLASKTDAGTESFGEVNPADLAELDAGAREGVGGSGGAAPAAAPAPAEVNDECTPVGVDFEKRARPRLKECYATGKKKEPDLRGSVRIAVEIDTLGKVKGIKILDKTLPDAVAQCMLKVVKATPLTEASKCPGKSFTLPLTFPTPR